MWDIIVPLILMVVFYLVPELLKKKRRQEEYKYPDIPDGRPAPTPDRAPPPGERPRPAEAKRPEVKPPAPGRVPPVPDIVLPPVPEERPRPAVVHRPPEPTVRPAETVAAAKLPPALAVPAFAEAQPWAGRLDRAAVLNGIIFAEIIQPPRAKRPMRPGFPKG